MGWNDLVRGKTRRLTGYGPRNNRLPAAMQNALPPVNANGNPYSASSQRTRACRGTSFPVTAHDPGCHQPGLHMGVPRAKCPTAGPRARPSQSARLWRPVRLHGPRFHTFGTRDCARRVGVPAEDPGESQAGQAGQARSPVEAKRPRVLVVLLCPAGICRGFSVASLVVPSRRGRREVMVVLVL